MNSPRKIAGIACLATLALCSGCWFGSDDDHSKKAQSAPMDLKAETKTASELSHIPQKNMPYNSHGMFTIC